MHKKHQKHKKQNKHNNTIEQNYKAQIIEEN